MTSVTYKKLVIISGILMFGLFVVYAIAESFPPWHNPIFTSTTSSCQTFPQELSLEEAESLKASSDVCWWVDSGATFSVHGGIGQTQSGPIYHGSRWKQLYAVSDPIDTEKGLYPQNIFRLINKVPRQDFHEEVFFNIKSYHASKSPNRNESNGVVLLGRYADADNLYYAGVRVDGMAVIKRKLNGVYETLGTANIANPADYDRVKNPNLLPTGEWIGVAMDIKNETDTRVMIRLDIYRHDMWQTALTVVDDLSQLPNGIILTHAGNTGIRTDFMDVEFKDYKIITL